MSTIKIDQWRDQVVQNEKVQEFREKGHYIPRLRMSNYMPAFRSRIGQALREGEKLNSMAVGRFVLSQKDKLTFENEQEMFDRMFTIYVKLIPVARKYSCFEDETDPF